MDWIEEKNNVKILKKHLKLFDGEWADGTPKISFDDDIYILQYLKPSFFGSPKWTDFPVFFRRENVLQDFIKTAYIFDFQFDVFIKDGKYGYVTSGNDCWIELIDLIVLDKYRIFGYDAKFSVTKGKIFKEYPKYKDGLLSKAYARYVSDSNVGLSDTLEEKMYKLVEG